MNRVRLFLVDGDVRALETRAAALAARPMIEVIGVADNGDVALERMASDPPDLVVLDVRLPPMGGFEASRRIKAASPAPVVILMSHHVGELAQRAAAGAGADFVVAKSEMIERVSAIALRMAAGLRA